MPELSLLSLPGVGPSRAAVFETLGVRSARDLAFFLPRTYRDLSRITPIADLLPGQEATVRARLVSAGFIPGRRGRSRLLHASFADGTGRLGALWFRAFYLRKEFAAGAEYYLTGKAGFSQGLTMTQPEIEPADVEDPAGMAGRIVPIYRSAEGLPPKTIRRAMLAVLPHVDAGWDWLPDGTGLAGVLSQVHFPASLAAARRAREALVYRECFLFQAAVARSRAARGQNRAPVLTASGEIDRRIRRRLPFSLRAEQEQVIREIVADMGRSVPMHRLLVGDVGSGKTAVALYAALVAVAHRKQAAFLAPTEILAQQHVQGFAHVLAGSRVRMALVTAGTPGQERRTVLRDLEAGRVDLVVGTHALLEDKVFFSHLALAVIDEQHRFGVLQRHAFGKRQAAGDTAPHRLLMTATPIPRTMERVFYGDLDVSYLRGLPAGRKPVVTRWVVREDRGSAYLEIRKDLAAGRQAYVVCPRLNPGPGIPDGVGAGPGLSRTNAVETARKLAAGPFKDFRVALVHGRLTSPQKQGVMDRFRSGAIQVLVATVVVEVGLDVPNATVLVVEQADRFGLSQLHQLRGRIGRGPHPSACYLFADPETPEGLSRLKTIVKMSDGFKIAEEDLRQRGAGEWFGTAQHGLRRFFQVFDPARDGKILEQARSDAFAWAEKNGSSWPARIEAELTRRLPQGTALGEAG